MSEETPPHERQGNWRNRRRFMYLITAVCVGCIAWILANDMDGEVAETAVTMSFTVLMAVTGSYVFGACWDYKTSRGNR